MNEILSPINSKISIKNWAKDLNSETLQLIENVAKLPFIFKHVAVMPDAHLGKGSTIGTVIPTDGSIIPAAVGVDIGCGMAALLLPFSIDHIKNLPELRKKIEKKIPTGHESHQDVSKEGHSLFQKLGEPKGSKIFNDQGLMKKALYQLGTLGGGNHFLEICYDKDNRAWILLHSGSRHIGKRLAEIHIEKAKGSMKKRLLFNSLPDPDLSYLSEGQKEFQDYIQDLLWAQNYAKNNRELMVKNIIEIISLHVYGNDDLVKQLPKLFRVDCHHNYAQKEVHYGKEIWITRKGAVSARKGEWGIIPGSMGTMSYIVKGKGNEESFCSCSHGAGRSMSRNEARKKFSTKDLTEQTQGIECRKDFGIVDEIPSAYKKISQVMEAQKDLVEVCFELKQVLCIKGN